MMMGMKNRISLNIGSLFVSDTWDMRLGCIVGYR